MKILGTAEVFGRSARAHYAPAAGLQALIGTIRKTRCPVANSPNGTRQPVSNVRKITPKIAG